VSVDTIERVDAVLVDSGGPKRWVFVRLGTRDGIVGYGECYTAPNREQAIRTLVEELGQYVIGLDVSSIRHFTRIAFLDVATKRGSMELFCAVSGIETAMWDALGRALGQPVHALLGGALRDSVRVYANGWSYGGNASVAGSIDETVARAQALVARGFDALKFDPFLGPWRPNIDRPTERFAVDCVREIRNAVGPEVDLLIEAHRRFSPRTARRLAHRLEPFHPFWFEEPVPSSNVAGLAEIRAATRTPIVTGEDLYTKVAFQPVLEARAVDIVNPDVASCGGILELVEIAAAASMTAVDVAPHNYNSLSLGLAATLQASAVIPNFLITEYFVNFEPRSAELVRVPLEVVSGRIRIPDGPGLGIDLDEAALQRRAVDGIGPRRPVGGIDEE
jgi:galactonate dehydratase